MNNLDAYQVPSGKVLVLRTSDRDRKSYGGFQWPEIGYVEAPDWKATENCGNGLHGALKGEGDGDLFNWADDAVWQVVEVDEDKVIDLGGKVKFPSGNVIYSGDRLTATNLIYQMYNTAVIGGTATAGYGGKATAGDYGTATAGYGGTATAGYRGTATAGYGGTATAGDGGTATAGYRGTATAGYRGTATAGDGGIVLIKWYDGKRYRIAVGYIGEDGLKPNVAYRLYENGKFVKAE